MTTKKKDKLDTLTVKQLNNIIEEENIPLVDKGSGKNGRIVKSDLITTIKLQRAQNTKKETKTQSGVLKKKCFDFEDIFVSSYMKELKYMAEESGFRVNTIDLKAAIFDVYAESYGFDYDGDFEYEKALQILETRYKLAKEYADDRIFIYLVESESNRWYRTQKYKDALKQTRFCKCI